MKDRYSEWNVWSWTLLLRLPSLIVHLCVLVWQTHNRLPFNNSGPSLHAWPILLVTFSHPITGSSLRKWSKGCKELQYLLLDWLMYLQGEGRTRWRAWKLYHFFSNHINWSNKRYYFSQQLVLLISLDCHDYLLLLHWLCVKLVWKQSFPAQCTPPLTSLCHFTTMNGSTAVYTQQWNNSVWVSDMFSLCQVEFCTDGHCSLHSEVGELTLESSIAAPLLTHAKTFFA